MLETTKPRLLIKNKLLLVEGTSDKSFFDALFKKTFLGIQNVQVEAYKGKNNLREFLKTLKNMPGFPEISRIGITRDADDDLKTAQSSIQHTLEALEIPSPQELNQFTNGTSNKPNVGIFIFPNCTHNGELEDLCYSALNNRLECVEKFLKCIEEEKKAILKKQAKSKLYAYFSMQDLPKDIGKEGLLGIGVREGHFNFEHPDFKNLITFITQLNDPDAKPVEK